MISRREFAEIAFSQHAAVQGEVPPGAIWLNANENPDGPPERAKEELIKAVAEAGRYNHRVFPLLNAALARSVGIEPEQVMAGAGSTEVLHCALDAFTSSTRPLITAWPTWEMTQDVATAAGKPVIKVPLTSKWSADVERMAAEARKSRGGLIHLGNPNNPTSSITPGQHVRWLADRLPPNTVLLIDEAYIQFTDPADEIGGMSLVQTGRNVVVTRTFSKLYGMAGLRVGFGCAPAALIKKMQPFRNNVIGILGARAAMAAVELGESFVAERRTRRNGIRAQFCSWLDESGFKYIPPQANFVLIHLGRDVRDIIPRFLAEGVVTGRRFEAMRDWLRVAVGTEAEMEKFKTAFKKVVV